MDPEGLLAVALDAARRAGQVLLERFGNRVGGVSTKSSPTDLVSDADRAAEAAIVEVLRAARPHDGLLAEEGSAGRSASGIDWVVDPLDGTINYLFGVPHWCVALAATDAGGTVAAVIHDPNRAETFSAARGSGARLNGKPIRVSGRDELAEALVATGFSYVAARRAEQARLLGVLLPAVRDIRRAGSASLDLAWLACGRLDAFYEGPLEPWDRIPGSFVARAAGAEIETFAVSGGEGVVGANPRLAGALLGLVVGNDPGARGDLGPA